MVLEGYVADFSEASDYVELYSFVGGIWGALWGLGFRVQGVPLNPKP